MNDVLSLHEPEDNDHANILRVERKDGHGRGRGPKRSLIKEG